MLALDSPDWNKLKHAYGAAVDVPSLLQQLSLNPSPSRDYRSEPWFSLWSRLCHQDDVYTASYAAVPHVVRICLCATGPIDASFFLLPACIEIARATSRGPEMPVELSNAYIEAMRLLHDCAFKHAVHDWDDSMCRSVAAALAVAKAQIKVAEAIVNLNDDIMTRIIAGDW